MPSPPLGLKVPDEALAHPDEALGLKHDDGNPGGTQDTKKVPECGYSDMEQDGLLKSVHPVFWWIVIVNMVVKGVQDTLPALATLYFLKDDLGVGPVGATSAIAIVNLPWTLKPIYGYLSDNYPIMGMRRKPYVIGAMFVMSLMWTMMATAVNSEFAAIFCLIFANLGCAIANVSCEAITVELSSSLNYRQAATLQSFMWGSCAAGAFVGSAFGGFMLSTIGKRWMFAIMAVIPAMSAAASLLGPKEPEMSDEAKNTTETFHAFAHKIISVLVEKHVWRSCIFLYAFFAVPSTSAAAYFYFTNHLKMGESVMAVVMTVAMGTWLGGVIFYNIFLREASIRKVLGWGTVLASIVTLFGILLYTGANKTLGIPNEAFVVTDTSMVTAVKTVAQLPLMTMMAILCPKGAEATLYSTFTGIMNLGQVTGGEFGALLSLIFGITSHKFKLMWAVCLTAGCIQVVPLFFLWLLPSSKTLKMYESRVKGQTSYQEQDDKNALNI